MNIKGLGRMLVGKIERRLRKWRLYLYRLFWLWRHGTAKSSRAVFIFGAQRSGTTMLLACFEESAQFEVYGEMSKAFENSVLKNFQTVKRLIRSSRRPFVAFKPLTDSHRVNSLLSIEEGAKAIWIYRQPADRAHSAVKRFGDTNLRFLRELVDKGCTDRWEAQGVSEHSLSVIRGLHPASMDEHSSAAAFWFLRNQLFFDQQLDRNPNVLLLKYETLVTEAESSMQTICEFIGCEFMPRMIANIHAGSVGRSPARLSDNVSQICQQMLDKLDRQSAEQ